jgi:hypothetical protein
MTSAGLQSTSRNPAKNSHQEGDAEKFRVKRERDKKFPPARRSRHRCLEHVAGNGEQFFAAGADGGLGHLPLRELQLLMAGRQLVRKNTSPSGRLLRRSSQNTTPPNTTTTPITMTAVIADLG